MNNERDQVEVGEGKPSFSFLLNKLEGKPIGRRSQIGKKGLLKVTPARSSEGQGEATARKPSLSSKPSKPQKKTLDQLNKALKQKQKSIKQETSAAEKRYSVARKPNGREGVVGREIVVEYSTAEECNDGTSGDTEEYSLETLPSATSARQSHLEDVYYEIDDVSLDPIRTNSISESQTMTSQRSDRPVQYENVKINKRGDRKRKRQCCRICIKVILLTLIIAASGGLGWYLGTRLTCQDLPSVVTSASLTPDTCRKYPDHGDITCRPGQDGWITWFSRSNASYGFHRVMSEYEAGFGRHGSGEYWMGLRYLHRLTRTSPARLRIEITPVTGDTQWAEYDGFAVGNRTEDYKLYIGKLIKGKNWKLSDVLHSGIKFSTTDRSFVYDGAQNCVMGWGGGGWWYSNCKNSIGPTGVYNTAKRGPPYITWKGINQPTKAIHMKLAWPNVERY